MEQVSVGAEKRIGGAVEVAHGDARAWLSIRMVR